MPPPIRHDAKTRPPGDKYGAPGISFPTPNVEDIIVVEEVPMRTANYAPLEYGTPHPDIGRAKLTFQSPVKGNNLEKNVRRIYSTERADQDAYNYAITSENDGGFPTIIRSYVVRRADYERQDDYTPDSTFTDAVMTREEMKPVGDQELTSLDVQVVRVFEVLPGVVKDVTSALDANHGATLRTSQRVQATGTEDASVTVTTDTVTRISYQPTETPLVLRRIVETYAKNGVVLKGQEYDKLLGIVLPYTEQVQDFSDPAVGAAALGTAHAEVSTIDLRSSHVRTYQQAAVATALAAYVRSVPATVRVILPDELLAISMAYNVTKGEGGESSSSDVTAGGTTYAVGVGFPASATSSATITAAPVLTTKQHWGAERTPAMKHTFFVNGNFDEDDLRTRLGTITGSTVNAWPNFKVQGQTLAIHSAQMSLSGHVALKRTVSQDGAGAIFTSITGTTGHSIETGGSSTTLKIDPCIHGHLIIASPTHSETLAVVATTAITGGISGVIPTASLDVNNPDDQTQTITASVTPTELPATSPAAVPTTGLYLHPDWNDRQFDSENTEITALVIDMSYFLSYTIAATPSTVGYGTVAGIGEFDPGVSVSLVATAIGGHSFVNWTEGVTVVSASSTYTFTAAANRVLVAHFS